MNEKDVAPRVITVGDSGVGKTTLIHRIKSGAFLDQTVPTIGAGVTPLDAEVDGITISFQFWDTAGQEMYRNIIPIYFKGAIFAILVFSMSDVKSFQSLDQWLYQISENSSEDIITFVIGNKLDQTPLQVTEEEGKRWAKSKGLDIFFTSAKTGQNCGLIMEYISTTYSQKLKNGSPMNDIKINTENNKKDGCC